MYVCVYWYLGWHPRAYTDSGGERGGGMSINCANKLSPHEGYCRHRASFVGSPLTPSGMAIYYYYLCMNFGSGYPDYE